MVARLKEVYASEIRSSMQEQFGYTNPMQIPRLDKVVLNMGVGDAVNDSKKVDNALRDMTVIAGQKPVIVRARKSVATFKPGEYRAAARPRLSRIVPEKLRWARQLRDGYPGTDNLSRNRLRFSR